MARESTLLAIGVSSGLVGTLARIIREWPWPVEGGQPSPSACKSLTISVNRVCSVRTSWVSAAQRRSCLSNTSKYVIRDLGYRTSAKRTASYAGVGYSRFEGLLVGRTGLERIKPVLLQNDMYRFLLCHDDGAWRLALRLLDPLASCIDDVPFAAFL